MNKEFVKLIRVIGWDIIFTMRYQILTVAIVITVLYTLIFKLIPGADISEVLVSLIFSDPSMLGFMFIGAMVLFERDANTLQALTVTPLKPWQYLWSKAIVLTIIALFCSIGMAIAGRGLNFNIIWLLCGLILTSFLFIFIGFIGVSQVKTFNQYIILVPLFLFPAILPLADLYGIFHSPLFYLIPAHGSILLLKAAFEEVETIDIIYSLGILLASVYVAYRIAVKHYIKYIVGNEKN